MSSYWLKLNIGWYVTPDTCRLDNENFTFLPNLTPQSCHSASEQAPNECRDTKREFVMSGSYNLNKAIKVWGHQSWVLVSDTIGGHIGNGMVLCVRQENGIMRGRLCMGFSPWSYSWRYWRISCSDIHLAFRPWGWCISCRDRLIMWLTDLIRRTM